MNEIVKLLLVSLGAVVYLFIISKIMGKKQIAQLEFIDYVMGISIGSIAAEMATDTGDNPFWYYLIAMTIFFLIDTFVSLVGRKGPHLKNFFKGKPLMIIHDGEFNFKNLKKSKLDVNDVISLCREQGYFNLSDIAYAIFEISGKLSVLPIASQRPTVASDLNVILQTPELPQYLIVDGIVSFGTLKRINKDIDWLYSKIKMNKKEIKKVLLCYYTQSDDSVEVYLK